MNTRTSARVFAAPMAALMTLGIALQPASAQNRDGRIPADTVIRVELERDLDGARAREGDRFTAVLSPRDRSGFPLDTRFEGVVTESQRSTKDRPGILDAEFRTAILPDGDRLRMVGHLASLARKDNRRDENGRLISRRDKKKDGNGKVDLKWVGIGAGAGAVLATIMGESFFRGVLLGGLGGAVYGYLNRDKGDNKSSRNRDDYHDVVLAKGSTFGIRLDEEVDFASRGDYKYNRQTVEDDERGPGRNRPANPRFDQVDVRLDGTVVQFEEAKPVNFNGELYVPLRPIAKAADMDFNHRLGEDTFTLRNGTETIRGTVGETMLDVADKDNPLNAPISLNGEIYVSTDYLSRAAGLRVDWQERENRLAIHSYK
jgi:hypothetical protein